ncbi:MAG: acyl-CoA dehydratase activase [Erysipelotrichaceae bacterium]|nr:acyl-CoA dehydratase activase [Erysipelotrichaceae bacterium]
MIGHLCKYVPVEIFAGFHEDIVQIMPHVDNYSHAEDKIHMNTCAFIKAILQDFVENDYEGIVLSNCCDSNKRLYDVLKDMYPDKFIYFIDIPRKTNHSAIHLYAYQIHQMIDAYSVYSHKTFDIETFKNYILCHQSNIKKPQKKDDDISIGLLGARCHQGVYNLLENLNVHITYDLTCTDVSRNYQLKDFSFESYAEALLKQLPCMRMVDNYQRLKIIQQNNKVDGLIYHTVKFCDNYSYEYALLQNKISSPILKAETDSTNQCEGQIRTRVEAFVESLKAKQHITKTIQRKSDDKMYILGIDSGSTSTNTVIMNQNKEIVAFDIVRTGAKSGDSAMKAKENVLNKAHLKENDIDYIVSTGYGRVSIPFADKNVTEISCHGKGAVYFNPLVRTILDIGGQDSKAIALNDKGDVESFVMNDKCAAGTGRFLEMMARTLEVDINDMGPMSLNWHKDIKISSMCSVFAESEVISLIAQNYEKSDIAHGLHYSIASKAVGLMKRVGINGVCMMSGGVAHNIGVVKAVEDQIGNELYICDEPEIVGAVGAALFGFEELLK